ncbi:MAG TPA: DUF6765 family protein [Burkholderiaceae bacterium]
MQIDFHFGATYAIARIAGFAHAPAQTIATAAQYVDDSTTSGFLRFDNGVRFHRLATAHPMISLENLSNDAAALSWLPFHFLPGNEGHDAPAPHGADAYRRRLVCRPDSPVARAMMDDVIRRRDAPHALHRLGIAAHVFIDTFAHQGFVGERDPLNRARDLQRADGRPLEGFEHLPALGHGQVGTYPDQPALRWRYVDGEDRVVERDNPRDFLRAADRLCQEFRRHLAGDPAADAPGLGAALPAVRRLVEALVADSGEQRLEGWLEAIAGDAFGFGPALPRYVGKGEGSWKHLALGDDYLTWLQSAAAALHRREQELAGWRRIGAALAEDVVHRTEALAVRLDLEEHSYRFSEGFLASDYKRFHDAAEEQRYIVFRTILPRFGIHSA